MSRASIPGIAIRGLLCGLPEGSDDLASLSARFGEDAARRIAEATGIRARRIAPPGQCLSDLAFATAGTLLEKLGWDPASVGLIVVVTQTGDYVLPATACLLQTRLGLPENAAAMDITLGCSGYVYGLFSAMSQLVALDTSRALLIAGDTTSHHTDPNDRAIAPLFGDAVSVTALEKDAAAPAAHFALGTDGTGAPYLITEDGGARNPGHPQLFMDGTQVFAFTLKRVPANVREVLDVAGQTLADIDHVVFHQANEMMLRHLGQKLGIAEDRLVIDMAEVGNTSSASIPVAMAQGLAAPLTAPLTTAHKKLLLCGFGVGWSWGSVVLDLPPLAVCGVIDVPGDVRMNVQTRGSADT